MFSFQALMQKFEYKDIANIDHKVAVVGLNFLLHIFHIRFKDKKLQSDSLGAMTELDDLNTRNCHWIFFKSNGKA
jgi:hypothetical protein